MLFWSNFFLTQFSIKFGLYDRLQPASWLSHNLPNAQPKVFSNPFYPQNFLHDNANCEIPLLLSKSYNHDNANVKILQLWQRKILLLVIAQNLTQSNPNIYFPLATKFSLTTIPLIFVIIIIINPNHHHHDHYIHQNGDSYPSAWRCRCPGCLFAGICICIWFCVFICICIAKQIEILPGHEQMNIIPSKHKQNEMSTKWTWNILLSIEYFFQTDKHILQSINIFLSNR